MVSEIASAPHLSWTDEKLVPGDMFYIEMGGVRHRYHSPLSRCIYLGKPTERMDTTAKVIAEGLAAVLDKVKPGVLCEELAATWTAGDRAARHREGQPHRLSRSASASRRPGVSSPRPCAPATVR